MQKKIIEELESFKSKKLFPTTPYSPTLSRVIHEWTGSEEWKALLFLMNGDLQACHEICQKEETPFYNHLHAILHRQEKDFSNSKYWYAKTSLPKKILPHMSMRDFVDQCADEKDETPLLLKQETEIQTLKEWLLTHSAA